MTFALIAGCVAVDWAGKLNMASYNSYDAITRERSAYFSCYLFKQNDLLIVYLLMNL